MTPESYGHTPHRLHTVPVLRIVEEVHNAMRGREKRRVFLLNCIHLGGSALPLPHSHNAHWKECEKWNSDRQVTGFIRQSPISFIKNEPRTNEGPLGRPDELLKAGAVFQVLDSAETMCKHTHTHTHIHKRENCFSIHSLRDEKEVREAKASSPRERLRVRRKDAVKRGTQKTSELGKREGGRGGWGWGESGGARERQSYGEVNWRLKLDDMIQRDH